MDVRVGLWRKLSAKKLMLLNCGVGEDSWDSLGLQGVPTSLFWRRSALGFLWREWCGSWNSSTLATSCEELTHWNRLWFWERLGAGGERDDRGWDSWIASPTRWMWVWVNSGSWWWTGRPAVLRFMGSQRVRYDWMTELNWLTHINMDKNHRHSVELKTNKQKDYVLSYSIYIKKQTECIRFSFGVIWASLVIQLVKNPPAKQETLVQFWGQEDLLQKG